MTPGYARTMAAYNRWMNRRLFEAAAQLPDAQRKRDLGAFFRSIHGTLNHLLLADRVWMGRFTGVPFAARSLDQELCADFAELREQRAVMDDNIVTWAAGLGDDAFRGSLTYTRIASPETRTSPFALSVAHFFNHQTHHRGQVTTLLMQSGVDPGVTDLIAMPPSEAA